MEGGGCHKVYGETAAGGDSLGTPYNMEREKMANAPYVPSVAATLSKIDAAAQHLNEGASVLQNLRDAVAGTNTVTPEQAKIAMDLLAASATTSRMMFAVK